MNHQEFDFNVYNTVFYGQFWKARITNAALILVHGMGEHSSRYGGIFGPEFIENNISIITFDQFGHGKTPGKRGHNPGYNYLLECITKVTAKAKAIFTDAPLFLYGHSMGGNLVINYALRKNPSIKGVIATSPFLKLAFQPPSWKLKLGKILQQITPGATMKSGLDPKAISRNAEEVKKYITDPLVHDRISPNYTFPIMEAGKWAIENAGKLNIPLLLLHGTGDRLTSYKASEEFAKQGNKRVTLKLFQGGYHELHNDLCRDEFLKTILIWIYTTIHKKHQFI